MVCGVRTTARVLRGMRFYSTLKATKASSLVPPAVQLESTYSQYLTASDVVMSNWPRVCGSVAGYGRGWTVEGRGEGQENMNNIPALFPRKRRLSRSRASRTFRR